MYNNKNKLLGLVCLWLSTAATAAPLGDFTFKSPAFSGVGYSSHVLTTENQERTRQKEATDKIQASLEKAKADAANTNIKKFMNNLESRIYAQISQNLATAMFANGGSNSGTLNFEGNVIYWVKDGTSVTLQVTDTTGNQTTVIVPLGSFQF
jgi:membrane-bound inhibitor of C-type lysozyme